ncbi:MAG: pyrroline-5-carboxylate reductase [Clostridiales bacterium]|nr:pyrroline-5-carboxylate reductase [Clostridiales bacterium]
MYKYSKKLGVIGVGNMASAILKTVINNRVFAPQNIMVFDIDSEKTKKFTTMGVSKAESLYKLISFCDYCLVSVKPAVVPSVLEEIKPYCAGKSFITIAAGVTTARFREILGSNTEIVRVMPNMTLSVGCGAAAIAKTSVSEEFFRAVIDIFSCGGIAEVMDEELLDAVTGINGSSPAYFYRIIDIMAKAAEEQGIDYESALKLAAVTMEGSAIMLRTCGESAETLIRRIATPSGTTIAALDKMEEFGLTQAIKEGLFACTDRSRELSEN